MPLLYLLFAAGAVMDVFGRLKSGNAARAQGDFNAKIAEQRAADAVQRGEEDAQQFSAGVRSLIGTQRAGFAAQGIDVGTGSAVDVQADASYLGALDRQRIKVNAAREAWGYRVDAENLRRGGQIAQREARYGAASTAVNTSVSLLAARYGWGKR